MISNLKELRELSGFTVQEVADRTGFSVRQIRRWEEVGFDWEPETSEGDRRQDEVLSMLNTSR